MSTQYARPRWWQVYLTFPLLVVLFMLDNRLKLSSRGHQMVQIGIILLVYGLIHLWLKANATALSGMDQRQAHGRITVIQVPMYELPDDTVVDGRPIFEIPASGIKDVLSDTFEMDYIDAEVFPIDEVSQGLKKE